MAGVCTTLIAAEDLVASPWKNGGGVTREIAVYPKGAALDAFMWRVSVADVMQSGPFSCFDGVDRTLVLLGGAGMMLVQAGLDRHVLRMPFERAYFAGETPLTAELHNGPTRDFNLMIRRGRVKGDVEVWRGSATYLLRADTALLFCASGSMTITLDDMEPFVLKLYDTLRIDQPSRILRCIVNGNGVLLAVRLNQQSHGWTE